MTPAGLPDPERHPHGTRARYTAMKCRCADCRAANTAYYYTMKERGELVDAEPCRLHILELSRIGIGHRTVEKATGIGQNIVRDILSGKKTRVREVLAQKILAVSLKDAADHTPVSAATTWKTLRKILSYGYTKAEISERLGNEHPGLQIGRRKVLARTERAILELHAAVQAEMKLDRELTDVCLSCGRSHSKEARQRALVRILPARFEEVHVVLPCLYENNNTGYTRFMRDCRDLGQWSYPREGARAA